MNPCAPFIRRPIMTTLVMAAILFFGILAFQTLPVSDLPNVDYPTIQVQTSYPGASPETVANNVTAVLEKQFTTVDGITLITSQSSTGSSTIVLQFKLSKPIEDAAVDVQAAINQAQALLPADLPYLPTYTKVNPSASPIIYLAITSATSPKWDLYEYGKTILGERLNMISGVAQVYTYGSPYAARIRVDPRKLAAYGIGIDEVAKTIQNQNVNNPVGTLYGPSKEFTIDVDGQLFTAEGYNQIILRNNNGAIVRISDVGYAIDNVQFDKFNLTYIDQELSQSTIVLAIQKQPDANTLSIIKEVNALIPKLQREIPASIEIRPVFDRSVYIEESVHDVEFTLVLAFLLVIVVIFVYLGEMISTIIPTVALPMSVIGTFAMMFLFGYSIDILSLLSITLSIGFLVDDAIVVLENIVRHVEKGKSPFQAALEGSKEICFTIVSMTMCLITVFIPLIFMGGVLGKLFREFAITIITAVLISGIVSLSLTPMLCSRFVKRHGQGNKKTWMERFSEAMNEAMLKVYRPSLEWALSHRKIMLSSGILSLVATIYLFTAIPKDFLPPDDLGFIQVFSETADGTSSFLMENYQDRLTELIKEDPSIESLVSIGAQPQDNQGLMFLRLKPIDQRASMRQVVRNLQARVAQVPGVRVFFKPLPLINLEIGTSMVQADYQYTLQSLNADVLYAHADTMKMRVMATPGFSQVNSDLHISQPQLNMHIRRDKASLLDVNASEIENTLNYAYANTQLSPINTPHNQYYVILETIPEFYKDPEALRQLYVRSNQNKLVMLSTLVEMKETVGPLTVNHINGLPSVTITFDVQENLPLGPALAKLDQLAAEILPDNVSAEVQGTANVFKQAFADFPFLLLITIFIIYVILGILYENFFHPITVMSTLPPAALGGFLTLLLFKLPISLYAFIGLIMLLGIVMKNGIIMVDFANQKITEEGKSTHDAIKEACIVRFRPILMTTIAALMGAVPIALGIGGLTALSRRPLGIVIVGGLIFSQVLTLYFTPVIFIEIERLKEWLFPTTTTQKTPNETAVDP